jgi:two-component system, OmpR family, phosphate regulon sensor histidine kinase PhoR
MLERKSLRFPIVLGVLLIVVVVALTVGWVLITVFGAMEQPESAFYWTWLSVGSVLFLFVLVGVIWYLVLSVKAINLNRRQSNFIDSVTHEFKSPIASLKLYLQTLRMRTVSEAQKEQFFKHMLADVDRLDGLVSHLLEAGYIDTTKKERREEFLDISYVIRDCVKTVCTRYQAPESAVELQLVKADIYASPVDANILFRNLIDNAVKYAGSPPKVTISTRIENEEVVTEVCDNGPGIPKAQKRKIFGRFYRLGNELERKKPGTGLGLYIVRTLVKQLGGRVQILDREVNTGTVFELRLPLAKRELVQPQ